MAAVTNQDKKIATTASGLVETNVGPIDRNIHPTTKAVAGFQNYAKMSEATEHTSEKTQFAGGMVIRVGDAVGPPSHDPHPHTDGGVKSHTYLKEARATTGCPNVLAEGKAPTRLLDKTTQNHGNSNGIVFDLALAAELKKMAEEAAKRCSLQKDKVYCDHGRQLDDKRILEIISSPAEPAKVIFEATRTNAVEPGDADCQYGEGVHTAWVVQRQKGGGLDPRKEEAAGDYLELDHSWFDGSTPTTSLKTKSLSKRPEITRDYENKKDVLGPSQADAQKQALSDYGKNQANQNAADQIARNSRSARGLNPDTIDSKRVGPNPDNLTRSEAREKARDDWKDGGADRYNQAQQQKMKNTRSLITGIAQAGNQTYNLMQFLKVFFWRKDPVRINVVAQACTGSLNSEILAFPAESVDFKFGQEEYKLVQAAFNSVEKFAKWAAELFPAKGKIQFKVLEDPEIGIKCAWKELKQDVPKAGLKKYQCNRSLDAFVQIKTIFGVEIEAACSIARFLDFIPGAGWLVEKICDLFGMEASVGIGITLGIGLGLNVKYDELENFSGQVKLLLSFKPYIFVRLRFRSNLHVEGRVVGKWEPSFSGPYPEKDEIFYIKLDKGDLRLGFEGMFYASVLWWEKNEAGEWWPESWRIRYQEQPIHFMKPVMSLIKN